MLQRRSPARSSPAELGFWSFSISVDWWRQKLQLIVASHAHSITCARCQLSRLQRNQFRTGRVHGLCINVPVYVSFHQRLASRNGPELSHLVQVNFRPGGLFGIEVLVGISQESDSFSWLTSQAVWIKGTNPTVLEERRSGLHKTREPEHLLRLKFFVEARGKRLRQR